jgi:hypothetical protein
MLLNTQAHAFLTLTWYIIIYITKYYYELVNAKQHLIMQSPSARCIVNPHHQTHNKTYTT